MNKILKSLIIVAASFAIVACNKETPVQVDDNGDALIELTIIASNPEAQPATRTEIKGTTPYWSVGDAIGVSNGTSTNYKFVTDITDVSKKASFKGSTTVSETLYAYYPYTGNGVNDSGAKVDLPTNQSPKVSSFDGAADIMVAKKFTVSEGTNVVEGLQFARLGAIVKIVLTDSEGIMDDATPQYPTTVSLTAESNLTGRVYLDMVNQKLGALYSNQSKTVTANYTNETKYAINGSNATYLIVYPQTLAAGSKLTITASTADYSITKIITVPDNGIELLAGKVTTLNIGLSASNITADSGASLPFVDNMSWADNGSEDSNSDISSSISTESHGLYSSASKAYKGIGGLKLGTSSVNGYIITKELDLSGQFYIAVKGAKWDGDLVVTIDDNEVINAPFADVNYVNIASGTYTKKSKVKIATSTKRGRLYSVRINSGEYAPAPTISVTTDNPMSIASTGGTNTIQYTISNPTTGSTLTATSDVTWISNINCNTSGEVTFNVAAQESNAAAREGKVTLSYPDADVVVVTINQAAAQGASGTVDNPYTVAQVRDAMDGGNMDQCYIKGKISKIVYYYDAAHATATFDISDDGQTASDQFEAFSVKFLENSQWAAGNSQIALGDEVIIYAGELTIYTNNDVSTYETKSSSGSFLYSLKGVTKEIVPTITKSDINGVSFNGVNNSTTSITLNNADGWTATVSPDGTIVTAASISNSTITYSVAPNTGSARTGTITVTLRKTGRTDATAIINVGQEASTSSNAVTVTYDFTNAANYPQSFPTVTGTSTTSATVFTIDGKNITIFAPNAYYEMTDGDDKTLFFGKSTASFATTAYIEIPAKEGYYVESISVKNSSGCAAGVAINIYNTSGTAVSTAVNTVKGGTMNFSLSPVAVNTPYRICSLVSGKNMQFDSIVIVYNK